MSRFPRLRSWSAILLLIAGCSLIRAQWAPLVRDANAESRIAWWRQARFGMFIHWGLYSIPGRGEWVMWNEQIPVNQYARLADQFHPDHFDPNAWAALAKQGGMKYMVLTARHHDGFALFNDPESTFTSVKSAAHRDIVADYVKAVRAAGLGVGLYYSPLDWRFPGYFFPSVYQQSAEEMRAQYQRQIHELASNYGKIDILWFDGGGNEWLGFGGIEFHGKWMGRPADQPYHDKFDWRDDETVGDLRKLQPGIIVDDRTDAPADFRIREGEDALGSFENRFPWELCMTIVDGAWGYDPRSKVRPLDELIHALVGAAGRDGNFLLNVGPTPDGEIPAEEAARIREIGQWLSVNGESIYGTRGGPWLPASYGVSTHNGKFVYVHTLKLANDATVTLPALGVKITGASILSGAAVPAAVPVDQNQREVVFHLPPAAVNPIDTVIKVELATPWTTAAVVPVP